MLLNYIINYLLIGNLARGHVPVKQPYFKNPPEAIKSQENETVFVPCLIDDLGESYVRWWKDQKLIHDSRNPAISIPSELAVMNDGLTIESAKAQDSGEYTCEVVRPEPWSPLKLVQTVQVMYPPKVFPIPSSGYLEVVLGEKVEIGCSAIGSPSPKISWRKTKNATIKEVTGENVQILQFKASNRFLSGIYQCEASNGIGDPARTNIILRILHRPDVEAEKRWIHSAPGMRAALSCHVTSDPESRIVWLFNGENLRNSAPRILRRTNGNQNLLLFDPLKISDFGNYTCRASNHLGTDEDSIQLSGVANPAVFKAARGKPPDGFELIWEVDSYSPVFEYKLLFRREDGDDSWIGFIIPADGFPSGPLHSKSYLLSGLDRFALYEAKIFSRNRFGWSDSSEIIKFSFRKPTQITGENEPEGAADAPLSSSPSTSGPRRILSNALIILTMGIKFFRSIYGIS